MPPRVASSCPIPRRSGSAAAGRHQTALVDQLTSLGKTAAHFVRHDFRQRNMYDQLVRGLTQEGKRRGSVVWERVVWLRSDSRLRRWLGC